MKERPILFRAVMVQAILDGRKTQTRRIVKPEHRHCPYGEVGDRLWVKEHIFISRKKSRIDLEIVAVRAERLQDISERDAAAEGWQKKPSVSNDPEVHRDAARDWFSDLFCSINGVDAWKKNPWVWVIEFKRIRP